MRALFTVFVVVTSGACGLHTLEADEDQPIDTADNVQEQGLMDCTERADTGYTNGNAFTINVVTVDGKPVEVDTADAYYVMQQAAAAEGVGLRIVSGFRTMAEQEYLYGCYVNCNCNSCNLAASPGHSNHQSGHALDLNTADAGVLNWLNNRGAAFGFARTVPSEVWHWEWWGGGPGGGPCSASPECTANPNFGGCNGTVITRCDEQNHVGSGDCGAFGAGCSVEGGSPHCVHPSCMLHLNGGEDGTFCTDDTKVGTCSLGVYSEGDCAAYGGKCGEEGGSGHCIHFMCWSHLNGAEDGSFCVNDTTRGTCALGAYTETTVAHCDDAPVSVDPPGGTTSGTGTVTSGTPAPAGAARASSLDAPPAPHQPLPSSVDLGGCAQASGAPVAFSFVLLILARRRRGVVS